MTLEADPSLETAIVEPRRRTLEIATRAGPGEIAAIEFGDPARPVDIVFLHANGFNALTYRSMLGPLAASLRILAIDQQGHGRSPQREAIETRNSWLGFRDDLIAILDLLDGPPVVLSGHSMGGTACVLATPERPDRVRALALLDPVIMPEAVAEAMRAGSQPMNESPLAAGALRRRAVFPSRAAAIESYRGRGAFKTWPEQALVDYVADGFRDRGDGQVELTCTPQWEANNFSTHAHDSWAAMHRVRVPVSILRAEIGSTCSIVATDDFIADNPAMRIETLPGTTHFLPIERPGAARTLLWEMAGRD
jgi:pimeloyl-ACP methyl ester carboxylesterase